MDVAVIIPLYNGAKFIRRTLEAVYCQSHLPSEVIVVDDGSSDESPQIVQAFDGVRLISNQGGKGAHFARDFGLKHTTAPLVAFLDQDDIWHPNHLSLLSDLLEKYPECPAVVSGALQFKMGQEVDLPNPTAGQEKLFDPWEIFPFSCQPTPSAVLFRRNALDAIGGWPTHCLPSDYYVCMRLGVDKPLLKNNCDTILRCKHSTSNGAVLSRAVLDNVNRLKSCLSNLLPYRLAVHPQDQEVLTRRLTAFNSTVSLLEAVSTSDQSLLTKSVRVFEESLTKELPDYIDGMLLLTVAHARSSEDLLDSLFRQLVAHWPQQADRTRFKLMSYLPTETYRRNIPKFSLYLHRWPLLANAILAKFWVSLKPS